jgi:hypothetical protein
MKKIRKLPGNVKQAGMRKTGLLRAFFHGLVRYIFFVTEPPPARSL